MKAKTTFGEAVNWEFVHTQHVKESGPVKPGPWCRRIIGHARANGYTGKITEAGACRVINKNLW